MGNPARNTEHLVPWKPGQSGNPAGRPRGARSKLTEIALQKLLQDFEQYGEGVIEKVRLTAPSNYLAAIVSLMPKQQEKIESPFSDLSDDELAQLEHWLAASRAKQIDQLPAALHEDARERADAQLDLSRTPTADEIMRADDIAKGRISATEAHINARNAKDIS